MNIAYTIWIEWLDDPVLRNQVIKVLKALKKISPDDEYFLFVFQPIYTIAIHHEKFHRIKEELKESNLKLIIIPCLVSPIPNWFNAKWYLLPFIFLQSFPTLLSMIIIKNIDILHCRSYPIMLAAVAIDKIIKNLKIVFDPRSPFPEENIIAGQWTKSSVSYRVWKILEKEFLESSNITVTITNTYVKHFRKISKKARFITIPNNVDVEKFSYNQDSRNILRSKMHVKDNEIIFAYVGSLGVIWNNPSIYAEFLIYMRKLDIDHRFLFITPNVSKLRETFKEYGIKTHEYFAVSAEPFEVPTYLSIADIGLNFMSTQDIRMSIKTCEYLAMGLPIIVNSNVMGAKEIVEQYQVGLVLKDLNNIDLKEIEKVISKKENFALRCREVACEKFSTDKVAKQYAKIYKSLSVESNIHTF